MEKIETNSQFSGRREQKSILVRQRIDSLETIQKNGAPHGITLLVLRHCSAVLVVLKRNSYREICELSSRIPIFSHRSQSCQRERRTKIFSVLDLKLRIILKIKRSIKSVSKELSEAFKAGSRKKYEFLSSLNAEIAGGLGPLPACR